MINKKEAGMTLIVKTITRLTVGLILIYGIYIVLRGHIGPGGGFAGGVIIALSFIHLMLAFGKEAVLTKLNEKRGLFISSICAIILLSTALFVWGARGKILSGNGRFDLFGGGTIPLSDIAAAGIVGAGLFVIFLALILLTGPEGEK
ncbi:MAG: MnhB domain-containing protein [Candidatus Omnitrophica bacterium]|nr:MnhB domain-containing protein [Candidatus Omnitrophota bacterium]